MRITIPLALLLCGCGNWSVEDLEYLYALPQKDALKSQLGSTGTTSQGLRRDALIGEPSDHYANAKKGNDEFNAFLDAVLTGLDGLRKIPPTTRAEGKRIWGPYPDQEHPGFDAKAEIVKTGEKTFEWSWQARKRGGEFVELGGGKFVATESLRKGRGEFHFDGVAGHTLYGTMKMKPDDPDRVDIGYRTSEDPVIVEVTASNDAGMGGYDFNRYADNSAVLTFVASGFPGPEITKISSLAAWNSKTAGEINFVVLEGDAKGGMVRQCWDEGQKIVYEEGHMPDGGMGMAGNAADCAVVPVLQSLPPFR